MRKPPMTRSIAAPKIADIQAMVAALPDRDRRSPQEIIGYDEFGLPS